MDSQVDPDYQAAPVSPAIPEAQVDQVAQVCLASILLL